MTLTRRRALAPLGMAAASGLAGCSLLKPVDMSVRAALLDRLPADLPRAGRRLGTLFVFAPETRPAYDTVRMAYSLGPHHVAYFARHEWAETPSQMLLPLLERSFDATGCCTAVVGPPYAGRFDHTLRTELLELLQDFGTEPPQLRLALRVLVGDREQLRGAHEIALAVPMRQKTPEAGVEAASEAMIKALRELVRLVLRDLGA